MSKFYFHVRRGNAIYENHEGADLASVAEAVARGLEDARSVMRDEPEVPPGVQWIEIVDDQGYPVRTVRFEAVAR